MRRDLRGLLSWPSALAMLFLLIPPLLFYSHPSSFWIKTDYETLGLADAFNMAYRIADLRLYPARGMMDHPGVPFYLMSWLALALTGYPIASKGPGFFAAVIEHVEEYHQITIWLSALVGATGVYVFARAARDLVPIGVVATGLLAWLVATPTTLFMFVSLSNDSFAIVINGLFFAVLVRMAYDREVSPRVAVLSACVATFAYLNKLSYIYIALAFAVAGILNLAFRRSGWVRGSLISMLFVATFLLITVTVGFAIIGRDGFHDLIEFHKHVVLGSGLYGTGAETVVSGDQVWHAIAAMWVDGAYAILIALALGACLVVGGFAAGLKGSRHIPVALISIGAGVASVLSAMTVIKHYGFHYTAGVSATLPSSVIAGYLLAKSWGYRPRIGAGAIAAVAILLMASQTMPSLVSIMAGRTNASQLVQADREDIREHLAGSKRVVEFAYRAPFGESGEGFVIVYAGVPRLTDSYFQSRVDVVSSMAATLVNREVGAYVIDKGYFPTAESIKAAPNVALLGPKPIAFKEGDKLIELRTVFLLIPG